MGVRRVYFGIHCLFSFDHNSLKAMIHLSSLSYNYMMYDQLLWETIDRDVTVERQIV